ncbi:MgtC family protein [Hyella patelloides LEGE 07179]|uniref:MgtC family protein n=1 Tax=Hyella patelloides LEGE 07179 TaxID=945734 RepID=A0A563W054_9CYAN|nr:MgtC/SapB family protein [Hyella patelloides]VEP17071.1 MgtC family protein [Hyella patelloides LEGE 07179]
MSWMDFAVRLFVSFFLGVGIGIERQWLRTRAILKTNVLVTVGAAMFVMLSIMTPGDASPTRISAQIVSGVGFLGGGVILREGASVKGTNTAATLWCAAAIGTLVGSGYLVQAYLGTFAVVSAHLLLRPLVEAFKNQEESFDYRTTATTSWDNPSEQDVLDLKEEEAEEEAEAFASSELFNGEKNTYGEFPLAVASNHQAHYRCHITCSSDNETKVLTVLLRSLKEQEWRLKQLDSTNILRKRQSQQPEMVEIKADFLAHDNHYEPECLEAIISSLKSDSLVSSISWKFSA